MVVDSGRRFGLQTLSVLSPNLGFNTSLLYSLPVCFYSSSALYLRCRNKPDFFLYWDKTEKKWLSAVGFIVLRFAFTFSSIFKTSLSYQSLWSLSFLGFKTFFLALTFLISLLAPRKFLKYFNLIWVAALLVAEFSFLCHFWSFSVHEMWRWSFLFSR